MRSAFVACFLFLAGPLAAQTSMNVLEARQNVAEGRVGEAMAVLRPAAEAGDPLAQSLVGLSYYYGDEGVVDARQAVDWLTRAAQQGYAPAISDVGWLYRYGMEGLAVDNVRARAEFERAALMGNPRAAAELASMLLNGLGGPADVKRGLMLLRWAADSGDAMATELLGNEFYYGTNGPKDDYEARRLFTIAAAQNFYVAQSNLVYMNFIGQGVPVYLALAQDVLGYAIYNGYNVAGSTMSELLAANPDLATDPLEAASYCIWSTDHAAIRDVPRDELGCLPVLQALSRVDLKAAGRMAQSFGAP